jgi:hypothetical protein
MLLNFFAIRGSGSALIPGLGPSRTGVRAKLRVARPLDSVGSTRLYLVLMGTASTTLRGMMLRYCLAKAFFTAPGKGVAGPKRKTWGQFFL